MVVSTYGVAERHSMVGGDDVMLDGSNGRVVAAAHGVYATHRSWTGKIGGRIVRTAGAPIELPAPVNAIALSSDGARAAVLGDGHLRVFGSPTPRASSTSTSATARAAAAD